MNALNLTWKCTHGIDKHIELRPWLKLDKTMIAEIENPIERKWIELQISSLSSVSTCLYFYIQATLKDCAWKPGQSLEGAAHDEPSLDCGKAYGDLRSSSQRLPRRHV